MVVVVDMLVALNTVDGMAAVTGSVVVGVVVDCRDHGLGLVLLHGVGRGVGHRRQVVDKQEADDMVVDIVADKVRILPVGAVAGAVVVVLVAAVVVVQVVVVAVP